MRNVFKITLVISMLTMIHNISVADNNIKLYIKTNTSTKKQKIINNNSTIDNLFSSENKSSGNREIYWKSKENEYIKEHNIKPQGIASIKKKQWEQEDEKIKYQQDIKKKKGKK